ncbi:MAG: hypothetical protein WCC89_20645 [Candidatus Sulfotelmatobacter sp.]
MNQIIGCVQSGHGGWEGSLVEAIAHHHFGAGSDTRRQKFRVSGQTTNRPTGLLKTLEETSSDVAGGPSQQDYWSASGIK